MLIHPKDVTYIDILSPTPKQCPQHKVTNIHLSPTFMEPSIYDNFQSGPIIFVLQSPAPTALFVQLKPNKLISIGSGTSSDLRLPGTFENFPRLTESSSEPLFDKFEKGTALNHITINGVDKLLSNGSTEVGLNGVNIIEETVLVHGDILRVVSKQSDRYPWTCPLELKSLENHQKSSKLQAYLS